MDEIPAQRDSLAYLKNAIAALRSSFKFRVGGHSKGGNCAIYACAYLDPEEKTALYKIYNNDGPGFTQERLNSENFKSIRSLIESYYPKFSIVGMLFESDSEYQVIDNDAVLIFQHDLFSWHILGKHFVTVPTFKSGSEFFGETFNNWYSSLDLDKKKKFILSKKEYVEVFDDRLRDVFKLTDPDDNVVLSKDKFKDSLSGNNLTSLFEYNIILYPFADIVCFSVICSFLSSSCLESLETMFKLLLFVLF